VLGVISGRDRASVVVRKFESLPSAGAFQCRLDGVAFVVLLDPGNSHRSRRPTDVGIASANRPTPTTDDHHDDHLDGVPRVSDEIVTDVERPRPILRHATAREHRSNKNPTEDDPDCPRRVLTHVFRFSR
jgi:hypothetical protein